MSQLIARPVALTGFVLAAHMPALLKVPEFNKQEKGPTTMNINSTSIRIDTRDAPPPPGDNSSKFAADQLRALVERIERLEEDRRAVGNDIAETFRKAKVNGYHVGALRTIVRMRKMNANDLAEQEAILDTYKHALGMLV